MGADSSHQLDHSAMETLQENTSFSGGEIKDWHKKFMEMCPDGQMTREQFQTMYEKLFPKGDVSSFADQIFRVYDSDKSGEIDFQEFLCTMSISSKGSIDEKLRWAFNLYDLDGNGHVTRKEAVEIIKGIYRMRGISETGDEYGNPKPEDTVGAIFNQLDKDSDGRLTDMEFVLGAKGCPQVLRILENFSS